MHRSGNYVDNAENRRLGRVGMAYGTSSGSFGGARSHPTAGGLTDVKCYKDNAVNRRLDRVGKPLGSVPVSRNQTPVKTVMKSTPTPSKEVKVYVNNAYNRRHDRVGKPLGSMPISRKHETYRDTELNRQLGRVGKPWGSCPNKTNKISRLAEWCGQEDESAGELPDRIQELYENQQVLEQDLNTILNLISRETEEKKWREERARDSQLNSQNRTPLPFMDVHESIEIPFSDLTLEKKIGEGGFGEVYWAHMCQEKEIVAVKTLRQQNMTKRRQRIFLNEASIFCKLRHPNVVRFIGLCQDPSKMAIVMEYMDISLYEALHIKEVDFEQCDQTTIMCDVCEGMKYLHSMSIAHCDLKSQNVLLGNVPNCMEHDGKLPVTAKITDFGLSKMKSDSSTSQSNVSVVAMIGTYRYSAPEILRGELLLTFDNFKMTDVYSMGLVFWELAMQEIPFEDMTLPQLIVHVGQKGMTPLSSDGLRLAPDLSSILCACWNHKPEDRPSCEQLASRFQSLPCVYAGEE